MQMEARPFCQPAPDQFRSCGCRSCPESDARRVRAGTLGIDGVEKAAELARAMATMQLTQHAAAGHTEGGKQTGCAVSGVVVAAALHLSGAHGQQRRRTVQRLNLALLIHAKHQAAVGRVEVESDDVADLVDEQRIAAQLEGLRCDAAVAKRPARCG